MEASFDTLWSDTRSLKGSESQFPTKQTELDWDALRVALTRLDHSPQNFKASVGRSGALSNRRPPSRSSRASSRASRRSSAESLNFNREELTLELEEDVVVPKVVNIEIQLEGTKQVLNSNSVISSQFNPNRSSFINKDNHSDIVDLKNCGGSYRSFLDKTTSKFPNYSSCSTPLLNGVDPYSSKSFEIVNNIKNKLHQSHLESQPKSSILSKWHNRGIEKEPHFPVYSKEKYDNVESSSSTEVVISDKESIADSGIVNRRTVIRISEKSKSASSLDKEKSYPDLSRDILERRSLRLPKESPDVHLVPINFAPEINSGINVSIKNPKEDWQRQRTESTSRMFVRQSDSENRPTRASAFNVRRTIEKRQIQQERRERRALRQKIREELRSLSESRNRNESSASSVSSYLSETSLRSKSLSSLDQDSDDYRNDSSLCKVQSNPTLDSEKENIRTYLFGSNLIDGPAQSLVSPVMSPVSLSSTDIKKERQNTNPISIYSYADKNKHKVYNTDDNPESLIQSFKSSKLNNLLKPTQSNFNEILSERKEPKVLGANNLTEPYSKENFPPEASPIPPPRRRSRTSKSIGQLTVEKENKPEWLRQAKERRSLRTPKTVVEQLSERAPSVISTQEPEWVSKARRKLEALNVCLTSTTDIISVSSQVTESSSAWSRGGLDALEDLKGEVSRISEELSGEASGRVDRDLNLLDRDRSARMLEYRSSHGSRDPSTERQRVSFDASAEKSRRAVHQQQLAIQHRDEVRFGDLKHDWGGVQKSSHKSSGKHKETRFGEIHIKESNSDNLPSEHSRSSHEKAHEDKRLKEELMKEDRSSPPKNINRPVMHFGDNPQDLFRETKVKSQSSSKFESISGPDPLTMTADQLNQNVEEYDFPIPKGNEDTSTLLNILRESLEKSEAVPEIVSAEDSDKPKPKSILKRKSVENVHQEVKNEDKSDLTPSDIQEDKKLGTLESYKLVQKTKPQQSYDNSTEEEDIKAYKAEKSINVEEKRPPRSFNFSFNPTQFDSNFNKLESNVPTTDVQNEEKPPIKFVISTHPDDVKKKASSLNYKDRIVFDRGAFHIRRSLREQPTEPSVTKTSPPAISSKITDSFFKNKVEDVAVIRDISPPKSPLSNRRESPPKSPEGRRRSPHQKSPDTKKKELSKNREVRQQSKSPEPKKKEIYHYKPKEVFLEIVDQSKKRSASLDKKNKSSLFEWEAVQRQRIEDEERNRLNKLSIKPVSNKIKDLVKFHSGFMSIFNKDRKSDYNGTVDGKIDILFQKIPSPTPDDDTDAQETRKNSMKSPYIVQKALNPSKYGYDKISPDNKTQRTSRVDKLLSKDIKSYSNSLIQSNLIEDKNLDSESKCPDSIKDPTKRREWVEKMLNTLNKENEKAQEKDLDDYDTSLLNSRLSMYRRSFHEYLPRKHDAVTIAPTTTNKPVHYSTQNPKVLPVSESFLSENDNKQDNIYIEKENISPVSRKKVKQSYNYSHFRNNKLDKDERVTSSHLDRPEMSKPISNKLLKSDFHHNEVKPYADSFESKDKDSSDERSCSPTHSEVHSVFETSREGSPSISEAFLAKSRRERSHSLRSISSVRSTPDRDGPVSLSSILERDPLSPASSTQRLSVSEELKEITEKYKRDRAERRLSVSSVNTSETPLPTTKRSFLFGMSEHTHSYPQSRLDSNSTHRRKQSPGRKLKNRDSMEKREHRSSSSSRKERKTKVEHKDKNRQEPREKSKNVNSLNRKDKNNNSSSKKSDKDTKGKKSKKETTLKVVKEHKHPRIEVKLVRRKSSLKKHRSRDRLPTSRPRKESAKQASKDDRLATTNSSIKSDKRKKDKESESENYESIRYRDGIGWTKTKTSIRRKRLGSESSDMTLARKDSNASRSERCFKTEASKALEKWAAGTEISGKLVKKEGQKYSHHVEEEEKEGKKYSKAVSRKVVRRGSRRLSQGGEILSETKEVSTDKPHAKSPSSETKRPSPERLVVQKALVPAPPQPNGVSRKMKTSTDGERYFTSSVHTSQGVKKHTSQGVDTKTTKSKEIIGGDGWEGEREMSGRVGERVVVERSVGMGCRPSTVIKKSTSQAKVIITKTKRKSPSTPV